MRTKIASSNSYVTVIHSPYEHRKFERKENKYIRKVVNPQIITSTITDNQSFSTESFYAYNEGIKYKIEMEVLETTKKYYELCIMYVDKTFNSLKKKTKKATENYLKSSEELMNELKSVEGMIEEWYRYHNYKQ